MAAERGLRIRRWYGESGSATLCDSGMGVALRAAVGVVLFVSENAAEILGNVGTAVLALPRR